MNELRKRFLEDVGPDYHTLVFYNYLVVAVKLPSGSVELITNNNHLDTKAKYYVDHYDDDFRLKTNPEVRIVGYMLV